MTEPRSGRSVATGRRGAVVRTVVMAVLVLAMLPSPADAVSEPGGRPGRSYIVTLDVADAGRAIDPTARTGRERVRLRARRTRDATARLERSYDFKASQRFSYAVSGFAAHLTPKQAAELGRNDAVASVRPARRFRIASQTVPAGIRRVRAAPTGAPAVDADIAVLDTGIGPVGGNELNIQGGVNCSGDGLGAAEWDDLYRSRHGTHVAGIGRRARQRHRHGRGRAGGAVVVRAGVPGQRVRRRGDDHLRARLGARDARSHATSGQPAHRGREHEPRRASAR